MKILNLTLENFTSIKNGLDANKIFIDFSTTENKICILTGPNGSGKTSILSMLHPFADVGNLDVRSSTNLILNDKDGFKEITMERNGDIYTIQHFYTHHKDKNHSVKSYIKKNGNELNVNGNVTSFKEYVKEELGLESDYLKLIRLGSNVTSLIELTPTERKNFMGKIMDDIGIFLEYYKSVNTKLRQLEEMISHSIDKEKKLGISDKDEYKKEIKDLEKEIEDLNKSYMEYNTKLAIYDNNINNIEDIDNLRDNLSSTTKVYNKMLNIINKKDLLENTNIEYYSNKINELNNNINSLKNTHNSNIILIQNSLSRLDTLSNQLREYQIQLSKEENTDREIDSMKNNLNNMRKRLREYEDILGDYKPSVSKEDLERFIVFLKNTQLILNRTYEFGKQAISKVLSLMKNNKNVINYINSHIIDIDDSSDRKTSLFISMISDKFNIGNEEINLNCDVTECKAMKLMYEIQNIIKNHNIDDKNKDESFYRDMNFVYNNLNTVIPNFSNYKDIIELLPDNIKKDFEVINIFNNIEKMAYIYNEKKMDDLLSIVTEYDNYVNLLSDYSREESILNKFGNISNSSYLNKVIKDTENFITEENTKIINWRNSNFDITEEIKNLSNDLDVCIDIKDTLERFDEVKLLYEKYNNDYSSYKENKNNKDSITIEMNKLKYIIDNKSNLLQSKVINLEQYKVIRKDISNMNKIYDDMIFVKNSLSSKQGMPLYFISNYLKNTEEITNELLDIVYDGKIYIDSFDITPTEFSIPFFNKGKRLNDVKYASQGELSFLSLAIAFALSRQVLTNYNIMLLDEIDGPLDIYNREKFIKVLENQIDKINAEQSFLITHNSMFSSYNVDIIDLSFKNDKEQYPLANFINVILD
nr:MAG TPA: STRUCTURAL MAINTENANCE OF CHROMOSOMES PROTEIN [Caudoviricetes sp.]